MKIKKSVREKYMELCPHSTHKCDSFSEIDFKIERAVHVGKVLRTHPVKEVQYGNLKLTVDKNTYEVIDIEINNRDKYKVSEKLKRDYDRKYYKVSCSDYDYLEEDIPSEEEIYELLFT